MSLLFSSDQCFKLSAKFKAVISKHAEKAEQFNQDTQAVTVNFRNPDYSPEKGGYHPVEVRLEKRTTGWKFIYITDFSYVDYYQPELGKEVDICFNSKSVYLMDRALNDMFAGQFIRDFIDNFLTYYELDVFTVQVECEN